MKSSLSTNPAPKSMFLGRFFPARKIINILFKKWFGFRVNKKHN
jgi:hypothetical protein